MKTLGFGLKSLLKDPQWAMKHGINPFNQTQGSIVGEGKVNNQNDQDVFSRAKKGDMDLSNVNNIFAQDQNKINKISPENNIFAQSKIGGAKNSGNIFEMMNKIDERHKPLVGAQGMQPMEPVQQMNSMNPEELQKKLGKKLNILM